MTLDFEDSSVSQANYLVNSNIPKSIIINTATASKKTNIESSPSSNEIKNHVVKLNSEETPLNQLSLHEQKKLVNDNSLKSTASTAQKSLAKISTLDYEQQLNLLNSYKNLKKATASASALPQINDKKLNSIEAINNNFNSNFNTSDYNMSSKNKKYSSTKEISNLAKSPVINNSNNNNNSHNSRRTSTPHTSSSSSSAMASPKSNDKQAKSKSETRNKSTSIIKRLSFKFKSNSTEAPNPPTPQPTANNINHHTNNKFNSTSNTTSPQTIIRNGQNGLPPQSPKVNLIKSTQTQTVAQQQQPAPSPILNSNYNYSNGISSSYSNSGNQQQVNSSINDNYDNLNSYIMNNNQVSSFQQNEDEPQLNIESRFLVFVYFFLAVLSSFFSNFKLCKKFLMYSIVIAMVQ